jgi:hypothetical protein
MRLPSTYLTLRAAYNDGANRIKIRLSNIHRPKSASTGLPQVAVGTTPPPRITVPVNPTPIIPLGTLGAHTQTEPSILRSASTIGTENNDSSPEQRMKRREERKRAREAAAIRKSQLSGVTQRFENNYLDLKKLEQLLQGLFPPGSYLIEVCF